MPKTPAEIRQSYYDTIERSSGTSISAWLERIRAQGFSRSGEIVNWLKAEHGLGHGHASLLAGDALGHLAPASEDDRLSTLFSGAKAHWRATYDRLAQDILAFGPDVTLEPNRTYVNLKRGAKKFGLLQASGAGAFDVGLKLAGVPAEGRLEAAGSWNSMVSYRVRLTDAAQADAELLGWLRQAYETVRP